IASELPLAVAEKRPISEELLRDQFGRLGGTLFELNAIDAQLSGPVIVPMSELNRMRRRAVELLEAERRRPPAYIKRPASADSDAVQPASRPAKPRLTALCRNLEQVQAVAARTDVDFIYADFEFIKQFPAAVEAVRAAGKKIALAVPRIHMPGETGYFQNILRLEPDAVLVRNTGAVYWFGKYFTEHPEARRLELIGDFSLNIANHKAVRLFLEDAGLSRVTP